MTAINSTLKEYLDLNAKYNEFYNIGVPAPNKSVFYYYTNLFNTFFPDIVHTVGPTTTKIGDLIAETFPLRFDDREIIFEDTYAYASFEDRLAACFLRIMTKKGISKDIIKNQIAKMRGDDTNTVVDATVLNSTTTITDLKNEDTVDTYLKTDTTTLGAIETLTTVKDEDATEANSLASKVTSKETKEYYAPAVAGGTLENAALKGGTAETVTEGLPIVTITKGLVTDNTETKTASGSDAIAQTGTISKALDVDNTLTTVTSGGDTRTITTTTVKPLSAAELQAMVEMENYIEECYQEFEPLFIGVFN